MSKKYWLFFGAALALLASLAFVVLLNLHYDVIPEILNEQNKAQWLQRRSWYELGEAISFALSAVLYVTGLVFQRLRLKREAR